MEKKNSIFLTGVTGFLGSHIALELKEQGYHVIGLVRKEAAPDILRGCSIEYCKGDLLYPETYEDALYKCNVVIHTAAITSFGLKDTKIYYEINYNGTKRLLESADNCGIKRFIYTSTRGTIGVADPPEETDENYPEKDIDKADDYIKSKIMAEKEVLNYSKRGKMACIILSPTALVGEHDSRPTPVGNILLSFLRRKTQVYMDGGINIIDVENAAQGFVSAINLGINGQVYIIGNENITLYDIFRKLSSISGVPLPKLKLPFSMAYMASIVFLILSKLTGRPPFATPRKVVALYHNHAYCNPQKAIQVLGLPCTQAEKALEKAVQWYKENSYF